MFTLSECFDDASKVEDLILRSEAMHSRSAEAVGILIVAGPLADFGKMAAGNHGYLGIRCRDGELDRDPHQV